MMKKYLNFSNIATVLVLLFMLFLPVITNQSSYYLQIAFTVCLYCYWASAWNIIGGYAGQFAMGNGVYIGIGAFAATLCFTQFHVTPWIGAVIGMFISVIFAYIISKPCFRLSGTYFSLATVAFLHITRYIFLGTNELFGLKTNGGLGILIPYTGRWIDMQPTTKAGSYYLALGLLIFALLLSAYIKRSKMGYYLQAIKTNPVAAETIGVDVPAYKMRAQLISAAMLSFGGSIYVFNLFTCQPGKVFAYALSLNVMIYCVIGGLGTVWGPVVGAASLGLLNEVLRVRFGSDIAPLASVAYGVALSLIVRFAPSGLFGLLCTIKDKIAGLFKKKKPEEVQNT